MKTANANLNHECSEFSDTAAIPEKWRGLLSCRQCKQWLTEYVANMMLNIAPLFLSPDQEFITNIKHTAYSTNNDREKYPGQHSTQTQMSLITEFGCTVYMHRVHTN